MSEPTAPQSNGARRIRSTLSKDSDLPPVSRYAAGFAGSAEISWSAYTWLPGIGRGVAHYRQHRTSALTTIELILARHYECGLAGGDSTSTSGGGLPPYITPMSRQGAGNRQRSVATTASPRTDPGAARRSFSSWNQMTVVRARCITEVSGHAQNESPPRNHFQGGLV
jgi:hypothetical protein